MNRALHILGKDLRRFWPMIALAAAIHVFGYCVALSNLDATRYFSGLGPNLTKIFQQAPLIRWVMVFLLSVWVILEDRAVGDRIAWLTRPIFARDLLVAKFCFLVVAIAVPAGLVGIGVALWLKAPLATALATGVTNLFFTLFGAAVCAVIAAISATMNQALLWLAGLFGSLALTTYVIFQVGHFRLPPSPVSISPATSFIVVIAMTSLAAITVVGHQYVTLRAWRTVLLAVVLAPLVCIIDHYWPTDFWPQSTVRAPVTPTASDQLKLLPADSAADFRTNQRAFGDNDASVLIPLYLEGRPSDRAFVVDSVASNLIMDDGRKFPTFIYGGPNIFETPLTALSVLGTAYPDEAQPCYVPAIVLPMDLFEQLKGRSGRLTAEVKLSEKHYDVMARLPVQGGAQSKEDGHLSRIRSVELVDGYCGVGFQFAQINPVLGTLRFAWPNREVLVNVKRKEYSEAQRGSTSGTGSPDMTLLTTHDRFAVTRSMETSAETGKVDAAWLKDAELVFLVADEVRGLPLSLSLTVDKLTIPIKQIPRRVIVVNPDGTRTEYER